MPSTFSEAPPETTFQRLQDFLMLRGPLAPEARPDLVAWLEDADNRRRLRDWMVEQFRGPGDAAAFSSWKDQVLKALADTVEREGRLRSQNERELAAALDALYKRVEAARGDVVAAKPKEPGEDRLSFINNLDLQATAGVKRWLQKKATRKLLAWYGHINYRAPHRRDAKTPPAEWAYEPVPAMVRRMVPLAASTSDVRKQAERRKLLSEFRLYANLSRRLRDALPLRLIDRAAPLAAARRVLEAAAVRRQPDGDYAWGDGRFPPPDELRRVARLTESFRAAGLAPQLQQHLAREVDGAAAELARLQARARIEPDARQLLGREPSAYLLSQKPPPERLGEIWAALDEQERNAAAAALVLEAEHCAHELEELSFWKVGQKQALETRQRACAFALAHILLYDLRQAHLDQALARIQFAAQHKALSADARLQVIGAIRGLGDDLLPPPAKASVLTMIGEKQALEVEMKNQDALAEIERNAATISSVREISGKLP